MYDYCSYRSLFFCSMNNLLCEYSTLFFAVLLRFVFRNSFCSHSDSGIFARVHHSSLPRPSLHKSESQSDQKAKGSISIGADRGTFLVLAKVRT